MGFELQPHQAANVELLIGALKRHGGAIDGSDTGTGKTYTAVGLCKILNATPAIITRKAVIPSWQRACREAGVTPLFITNYEQCKTKGFPFGQVVQAGKTRKYEWSITAPRTIFIFDEAQALRSPSSINTKMALAAHAKFKTVLVSATPFQTPLEAYCFGLVTRLFRQNEYYTWLFKHGVRKNHFGYMEFIGDKKDGVGVKPGTNAAKGLEVMDRLREQIFPERGCRTRREQIPGFPDSLLLCEAIETGEADAITKAYEEEIEARRAEDLARARKDVDPEFHEMVDALPVTKILRARQKAEVAKAKAIAEMAAMHAERGESVAIFVNFDATIELISNYLKCSYVIRGDGSGRTFHSFDRQHAIDAFQSNRTPYIIVNTQAGGAGLSLHDPETKRPRVALISPPYSAVDLKQVLGRTHRLGGGHSTQKLLFAAGTVEEQVMARVQNRLNNLDALLDTDVVIGC